MNRKTTTPFLPMLLALALAGCADPGETVPEGSAGAPARDAATLPIPDAAAAAELPAGHPPVGSGAQGITATAPTIGLTWKVPEGWESTPPASNLRIAEYRVPGSLGDGECIVYYFGPGQGGDPLANARRWAGQFAQPDGSSSVERMTVETVDGAGFPTQVVEVTGTYDGGMTMTAAPAEARAGHMLLGGIVEGPDAPWFFKFIGPESTVRQNRDAFVEMLRTVQTDR